MIVIEILLLVSYFTSKIWIYLLHIQYFHYELNIQLSSDPLSRTKFSRHYGTAGRHAHTEMLSEKHFDGNDWIYIRNKFVNILNAKFPFDIQHDVLKDLKTKRNST